MLPGQGDASKATRENGTGGNGGNGDLDHVSVLSVFSVSSCSRFHQSLGIAQMAQISRMQEGTYWAWG
jgi:hypothetical protein